MFLSKFTIVCAAAARLAVAQLTVDQKVSDFEHLAALYAKEYAPYEWKRDNENFDLFDLAPWLPRVRAARNDLEFYDLMTEYVSRLNDAHSAYLLPSSFVARLHFTVDLYDGKALIDSINRLRLPASEFPIQIGDEVVSVDGRSAEELIAALSRYTASANPRSTRRTAAGLITTRPQSLIPDAIGVGATATVVIRDAQGRLATYWIPWSKIGLPLTSVGPVPSPGTANRDGSADYMAPLHELGRVEVPARQSVLGIGQRSPIFAPPPSYVPRLPRVAQDFFTSGTFMAGGLRIGLIRIPHYSPPNLLAAFGQFAGEVQFFQGNTDGLIIDQMRNPGGQVAFVNLLLQALIPYRFTTLGFEVRATSGWVAAIGSALEAARAQGAPQHILDLLGQIASQLRQANSENRGRTGSLPLDGVFLERDPLTDAAGQVLAYTRPIMVLCDEMSASGGDLFAATIQDNGRGPLFGMRTMGAGGSVTTRSAGNYTEGFASVTQSLMVRPQTVRVPGYPVTAYVENVGVHPDIVEDYMTRANLVENGRPFVEAFVAAMVEHIRRTQ